ncbi:MAG: endonuclease [Odoribacter sp.]|nr:endonuclease [Odoribacter sp.]
MRFFFLCVLCGGIFISGVAAQERCRVMFYNVENLFDTADDPHTTDNEFTPGGKKHWTPARYTDKLRKIAEVIDSIGQGELPAIVGLAEVENRWVLEDLVGKTVLADGNYGYVHRDSPDPRGIDVAMLYRKDCFQLTAAEFLRLSFPENPRIRTREILFASGVLGRDTVYIFVCHFPSMIGGEQQTEWRRVRAAETVRRKTDSLLTLNPRAAIVVMGDLNGKADTPAQEALGTRSSDRRVTTGNLYNTGYYLLKKNYGTYRYKGNWQTIDHLIVSGGLLDGRSAWKADRRLTVYNASFLLEEDKAHFGFKPRPTYRGPRYIGGYSDHLPVYLDLVRIQ